MVYKDTFIVYKFIVDPSINSLTVQLHELMLTELNYHVGWTTEIIYVNKAKDMYILLFIQAWVKNITTFVLLNKFTHLL